MTASKFDRNQILRQALQPEAGCPPLAELVETHFSGTATAAAEALRAHASSCPSCAAELALAGAFDASPRSPAEAQEIAWVAGQVQLPVSPTTATTATTATPAPLAPLAPLAPEIAVAPPMARVLPMSEMRAKRSRAARQPGEMSLWNRWAAAALVVVGLGFAFEWAHRSLAPALPERSDASISDVVRSGEVLLDSPFGVVAATGVEHLPPFAWRAVAGATSYRVEVRDVAGDLLWQGSSTATTLAAPPDLLAKLETLVTYRWNVTALDAAASAVAHSAPASFRVEPPAN
jgi:hypothetical protein